MFGLDLVCSFVEDLGPEEELFLSLLLLRLVFLSYLILDL